MKKIIVRAFSCLAIGVLFAICAFLDSNSDSELDYYNSYTPIESFIGVTLFVGFISFVFASVFVKTDNKNS